MIFLEILQTFYSLALAAIPLFVAGLAVAALTLEYFPAFMLDRALQQDKRHENLVAALLGVAHPATTAFRVPLAAHARRAGMAWAPLLTFIGAAGAGLPALLLTTMIGWRLAVLRLIVALIFSLLLSLAVTRFLAPRYAAAGMDADIEPLFSREFSEGSAATVDEIGGAPTFLDFWRNLLRYARVVIPWFLLSLLLAAMVEVLVSDATVQSLLGGRFAPLKAALIGVPFYLVGGTEVPLLYVLLDKGMGVDAAVAMMLGVPLVNLPVLSVFTRWLGLRKALWFLATSWLIISAIGLVLSFIRA